MMRREFDSREEMTAYLEEQFPQAAGHDTNVSPTVGGAKPARRLMDALQPGRYAFNRNYLDGNISRLSPYIRHGVITLAQARDKAFALVPDRFQAAKFVTELAWRDYWQRLYNVMGAKVWEDQEPYKTGLPADAYQATLPPDIAEGRTGLACIDAFVSELRSTGYLHNHARMWFAAYVVHFRRVSWRAGAAFFLQHLLDGDPASNNLSWQWVASTFSHKPYFFNRENLEKYTAGVHCQQCPLRGRCDFEGSYEALEDRLFRVKL
jgi:deoxyribodipyrimidine photo-lyase